MPPPETPERPFEEPWQAQVFALAVALVDRGVLGRAEWAETLGRRIAAHPEEGYWLSWLAALEDAARARGLASADDLLARRDAWDRAAKATPHGQPITLDGSPGRARR